MVVQQDSTIGLVKDLTYKNQRIAKVMAEACRSVLELDIPKAELVDVRVYKLAIGVCNPHTELAKVQLEMNLKTAELQFKAQPSTPPKIREQCKSTVKDSIAAVDNAIKDYTILFE